MVRSYPQQPLRGRHGADGQGDYARAQASFAALGGYRDSAQRVRECAALEALAAGDVEGVLDMLDSLQQDGDADAVRRIQDVAIPAVGSWQENGFSPRAVLPSWRQARASTRTAL